MRHILNFDNSTRAQEVAAIVENAGGAVDIDGTEVTLHSAGYLDHGQTSGIIRAFSPDGINFNQFELEDTINVEPYGIMTGGA